MASHSRSVRRAGSRAQINQVFIYLAAILVIGAIAVIGSKAILSIMSTDCEAKNSDFVRDLNRFIGEYSDKGSVHFEVLPAPCNAREVCFVSYSKIGKAPVTPDVVVMESVRDKAANVFLKGEFTSPVGLAEKLEVPSASALLCINVSGGYFKLKFTGMGRTTLVEQDVRTAG